MLTSSKFRQFYNSHTKPVTVGLIVLTLLMGVVPLIRPQQTSASGVRPSEDTTETSTTQMSNTAVVSIDPLGSDAFVLTFVTYRVINAPTDHVNSMDFDGDQMHLVCKSNEDGYATEAWYYQNPPTDSSFYDITAHFTDTVDDIVMGAVNINGVDNNSPIGAFACNYGATGWSSTPAIHLETTNDYQLIYGTTMTNNNSNDLNIDFDSEEWKTSTTNTITVAAVKDSSNGDDSMTWSGNQEWPWSGVMVAINGINSDVVRQQTGDKWGDLVLGKKDFSMDSPYSTTGTSLFLPHGVFIDRTIPSDNKMYVYDAGNNRILGFDLPNCLAEATDPLNCTPDIIIGQPDLTSSGCNYDSNYQNYPTFPVPDDSSLCGMSAEQISTSEGGSGASMAVDAEGNLYVADFFNNRVLKYDVPFLTDSTADDIWGQLDYTNSGCNQNDDPSATSLCFSWGSSNNWTAAVDIDALGNLWVTDSANHRVLRYPSLGGGAIDHTADLVLGQADFTSTDSGTGLDQMIDPSAVRVAADGKVFVSDHNGSTSRVLVYDEPTSNGEAGAIFGSGFVTPSGLDFDDTESGKIWITNQGHNRVELWDIGTETMERYVGHNNDGNVLGDISGSIGVDSDGNLYAATGLGNYNNDVIAFNKVDVSNDFPSYQLFTPTGTGNYRDEFGLGSGAGAVVTPDQVILADYTRLLFWNSDIGLYGVSTGQAADGYADAPSFTGANGRCCEVLATDKLGHLYTMFRTNADDQYAIAVYDLPLTNGEQPSHVIKYPFNVLGGGTATASFFGGFGGMAVTQDAKFLWIADPAFNRVMRIRNPLTSPVLDAVIGQADLSGNQCNRGGSKTSYTLCNPGSLGIDKNGNLYLSDFGLEGFGNGRLMIYENGTFATNNSSVIYETAPDHIIDHVAAYTPGFSSMNNMAVGWNSYFGAPDGADPIATAPAISGAQGKFAALYSEQLSTNPEPVSHLKDYSSMIFQSSFDYYDNLITTDLDRGRAVAYYQPYGLNNAPVVSEVSIVDSPTIDNTPTISFYSTHSGGILYNGSCTSGTTSAVEGLNTVTFDALSDAIYSDCTITVVDANNNASAPMQVSQFTVNVAGADVTPPDVAITDPTDGSNVTGTHTIQVTATDDEDVDRVEFYVDGILESTDFSFPYSYDWDTTEFSGGTDHDLMARAYDTSDNSTDSDIVTVTVLDNVPTGQITFPTESSTVTKNTKVTVTADADAPAGVNRVDFYVNGIRKCADTTAPYSCQWVVPRIGGSFTLMVKTIDASGQTADSSDVHVTAP